MKKRKSHTTKNQKTAGERVVQKAKKVNPLNLNGNIAYEADLETSQRRMLILLGVAKQELSLPAMSFQADNHESEHAAEFPKTPEDSKAALSIDKNITWKFPTLYPRNLLTNPPKLELPVNLKGIPSSSSNSRKVTAVIIDDTFPTPKTAKLEKSCITNSKKSETKASSNSQHTDKVEKATKVKPSLSVQPRLLLQSKEQVMLLPHFNSSFVQSLNPPIPSSPNLEQNDDAENTALENVASSLGFGFNIDK